MDDNPGISSDLEERFEKHSQTEQMGSLRVSEEEAYVGDEIVLRGTDLEAREPYELIWHTARGYWGVLRGNDVVGPQYEQRTEQIAAVRTDGSGSFTVRWKIPEDYGGDHKISVQTLDGESVATDNVSIVPWFEIDRTVTPLGAEFTITGYGIGPNYLTNNYQVTWDNTMVGFMTGIMNRGTANAQIRAVGPVGDHVIQIWRNFHGVPFLQNNTQSPFGQVSKGRQTVWMVEVTEPDSPPPTAWMDDLVDERPLESHLVEPDRDTEARLGIEPTSGQPGTTAVIQGEGFPAETTVDLTWYTHEGHHIKGSGISPEPRPGLLPDATTDGDGAFETEITIPSDVGATRPITADVDGESIASTGFMLQPAVERMTPTEGPVGTEIEFALRSVGWTMYDTAYFFVYDNQRVGYLCGSDHDDGVAYTVLRAAGEPGYHFIDVYPGFFRVEEDEPNFVLKPHLSYLDNHPVRPLPAFHFTFEVTE